MKQYIDKIQNLTGNMSKITVAMLLLVVIGIISVSGCIQKESIQKQYEPEPNITKYITTNTQYLVTGRPVKYTFEEINKATQIITVPAIQGELSQEAKQFCLNKVYDYIYTFPGYKYERINGTARTGNVYDKDANVYFRIDADGLSQGFIATENGKDYGDIHTFELRYDENTKECKLLSYQFFNWIIPKEIYDNAVSLAMEHPVVKGFVKDSGQYDLYFNGWIDDYKGNGTTYRRLLNIIDFKQPVQGIVLFFLLNSSSYNYLGVYVDMFNGEIFTEGPIYITPV
jgi:hypothetical protein